MNERRKTKRWCAECKKDYEDMSKTFGKEKVPPCEQCFPGIHERNVDAWEVYQMASIGSMGLTVTDIDKVCEIFGVASKDEVILKVRQLVGYMQEFEGEKEDGLREFTGKIRG